MTILVDAFHEEGVSSFDALNATYEQQGSKQ